MTKHKSLQQQYKLDIKFFLINMCICAVNKVCYFAHFWSKIEMVSEMSLELPKIKVSDNLSCSLQVAYAYSHTHKVILICAFLVLNTPQKNCCAWQELLKT